MGFISSIKKFFSEGIADSSPIQSTDVASTLGPDRWPAPPPTYTYTEHPVFPPSSPKHGVSNITPDYKATHDYIQEGFEKFHADNPQVYSKLVELAQLTKANGHKQIGIGLLWERLRFYYTIETTGDRWKLNNSYRAYYARKIMNEVPSLSGFFKTRKQWADL